MKSLLIVPALLSLLSSCGLLSVPKPRPSPSFFPTGVYEGYEKAKYCRTWDTIYISKDPKLANVYHVTRHTAFQRNTNDDFFPIEHTRATWTVTYDEPKKLMYPLTDDGHNIGFLPSYDQMLLGETTYQKIE